MLGTPGYMAPEQARGEPMIDARADVFSLGCVLYECLSGRRAFDGDSPMAILAKVLLEEPPPLRTIRPDIPAALEHVVSRMLSKSKEARYASAADVARDLNRLDTSTDEGAVPTNLAPGSLTTRERKLLCLLLARRGEAPAKDTTLVDAPEGSAKPGGSSKPGSSAGDKEHPAHALSRELSSSLGTSAEVLVDGSLVVVIEGTAAVDQAARAARAALRLRELGQSKDMALHLAIATGRGEISGTMPFGEVVDRACALLDSVAEGGGVRVDVLTSNLIEGRFRVVTDEHGSVLMGELDAEGVRSLLGRKTQCVGREREIGTLVALFAEVKDESAPRMALVTGEAGTGKSRLKMELVERLREDNPLWLFGGGDVAQPGAPFGALQSSLRRELSLRPEHSGEERRSRVVACLMRTMNEGEATRVAPFLAQLAGAPFDEDPDSRVVAARADAMVMGDSLRAAWQDFIEAEGRARPVVLVLEDMQWGDRPSMTFAHAAIRALKSTPLLVMVTARPDVFSVFPDLVTTRGLTQIEVGPLGHRASVRLLERSARGQERRERRARRAAGRRQPVLARGDGARGGAGSRQGASRDGARDGASAPRDRCLPPCVACCSAAAVLGGRACSEEGPRRAPRRPSPPARRVARASARARARKKTFS